MNALARALVPFLIALVPVVARAADPSGPGLTPGVNYQILPLPPQAAKAKPEVVYFFWVGCKHCARLEQALPDWLRAKGDSVSFRRVPAVFRPVWRLHALAYYAAESLGQGDHLLKAMYKALIEDNHELKTREELVAFAESEGLDKAAFIEALDNPAVKRQVLAAERLQKKFLLAGVPSLVVDEHYVTNGKMTGTVNALLQVTDALLGTPSGAPQPEPAAEPLPEPQTAGLGH